MSKCLELWSSRRVVLHAPVLQMQGRPLTLGSSRALCQVLCCCGLNCVPPKKICPSPNPQYQWMWSYLKIGSLQMQLVNMRSYWNRLVHYDWCSYKKEKIGYKTHTMWGDMSTSQGMPNIASKPPETGRVAWNRFSLMLREGTNPTNSLVFQSPKLQEINVSHPVSGSLFWKPRKLTHLLHWCARE